MERHCLFSFHTGDLPYQQPSAQLNDDGSFCSERLGPGSYFLYFTRGSEHGLVSAIYYPGVFERSRATAITVVASQDKSGIVFNVPKQRLYSVRGFLSTNDKSGLGPGDVSVVLVGQDGIWLSRYGENVDFTGFLPFPKTKYFRIDRVAPGRYVAYVSVSGQGWETRKVEVEITNHDRFVFLELRRATK